MFLKTAPDSLDAERLFKADVADGGHVMNLTRLWAWRPDLATGFSALRSQLMARSKLSRRDWVIAAAACASTLGDSYCSLSFGSVLASMTDAQTSARLLRGEMPPALTLREHAIAGFARQLAADPNAVTPADIDALRSVRIADREIFELAAFVAFRLAFSTVNDALGAQPDREMADAAPQDVLRAVDFGRPCAAQSTTEPVTEPAAS